MLLKEALGLPFSAHCVCAVGAGGKTSLLYALAEEYRREGKKVLLTTTTKMFLPEQDGILDASEREIIKKLEETGFAVAGMTLPQGKMGPFPKEIRDTVFSAADIVFVEADGAKRLPLKIPRDGEPVLPKECDFLVTVAGLSALDQPWREVCHRFSLVSEQISGETVTPEEMVWLLEKRYGSLWKQFSGGVFLNQADCVGWDRAEKTAALFSVPCAWGSLTKREYRRREEASYERSI